MENAMIAKLILMIIFFLQVTIFGNYVSSLSCFKNKKVMDLAMTFSGSLFFSIAMIDVVPEAINSFDQYLSKQFKEYETSSSLNQGKLPLTMIIAMITLILVMGLDKLIIGHSHDHEYEISFVAQPRKKQNSIHFQNHEHVHKTDQLNEGTPPQLQKKQQFQKKQQSHQHQEKTNWKPFILQIGMLIHAFFQTLAVGLQKSTISVLSLAMAIVVHKWAEGLTLGLLYKKEGFKRSTIIIMILFQGSINILGLFVGSILMGKGSFIMAFFMSMSAGTFLYISLVQVLQQQFRCLNYGKISMVVLANVFVALIVWFQKFQEAKIQHNL